MTGKTGGSARGGNGRFARNPATAQRDADAAALKAKGWSLQRIANELGFASKGAAHNAIVRAFRDIPTEAAEEAKRLDLERIDTLIEQAWSVMERMHVTISEGRVVRRQVGTERDEDGFERLDDKGKPIPVYEEVLDDGPVLQSIDRIDRLLARRAKIIGYEAPTRSRIEVITEDAVDAELKRLAAEVAGLERDHSGAT